MLIKLIKNLGARPNLKIKGVAYGSPFLKNGLLKWTTPVWGGCLNACPDGLFTSKWAISCLQGGCPFDYFKINGLIGPNYMKGSCATF